ncbi:hypothetical protein [Thermoflexus sp.]|uniref:hypothetical protein n=1 Tax=Thermoflexus sp. TaxID=1969742 RepID=UPI002ADD8743|nr:hypothetical protein [Thermoflexus sp.]
MAFTVADFHDLVRLLEQHEEWRKELRRLLLTDELLNLPDTVHELRKEVNRRFAELARSIRDLSKTFTAHRQEFLAHQAQTEARFAELSAEVRALAEAQRRHYEEFTAQRAETDRRFAELAEAQRRTEETLNRLAEAFTTHRQEFLEYRTETDRRFAELAEAQRRTEESLVAHRAETDRRFAELSAEVRALAEAQRRHYEEFTAQRAETDRRFAELSAEVRALAEAQRRTEEIIQQILLRQEQFQRTLDRFGQTIGVTVEGQMVEALQRYLRERGYALLEPITTLAIDQMGELDGVARVRGPDGNEAWVLVSVKARVSPRAVHEFVDLLRNTRVVQALQAYGIRGNVLPLIFGVTLDRRALEIARESQVGLLLQAQGELIAPRAWILETLEPS